MNNILLLLKLNFSNSTKFFHMDLKGKDKFKNSILLLIVLLALLPLYIGFLSNVNLAYDFFTSLDLGKTYLQLGIVMTQLVIFIFTIPKILDSFYYDTDIEQLLPLPFSELEITISKLLALIVREYIKVALIYLPFLFIYAVKGQVSLLFYLYGLLLFLLLPVFPILLNLLIVMVFMKFTNIGGKKDLVRGIGMVALVLVLIFGQLYIQKKALESADMNQDIFKLLEESLLKLSNFLKTYMPLSSLSALALYRSSSFKGLGYMLLYSLSLLVFFLIVLKANYKIYMDGLLEGKLKKKAKEKKEKKLAYRQGRAYLAIAKKELIVLFKNPVYFLNSIMGSIMMPIILILTFSMDKNQSKSVAELYHSNKLIGLLIYLAIILFSNVSGVSSTSFSREGKSYWIQQHLPIRAKDQALGRIIAGVFMLALSGLVLGIGAVFLIKISLIEFLLAFILSILLSLPLINMGLNLDLNNPKLDWTSHEEAMKQNTNVLKNMGITMAYIFILFGTVWILYGMKKPILIYIFLVLIGITLTYISYRVLIKSLRKRLGNY